ncbi:MAG TPA: AraC family transcriptional regulator [Actinoplanes sp.]|nr:AraC family transcriptional regulator [Actinoplanes sp.]
MLEHRVLLESPIARVAEVRCPGGHAWSPEEQVGPASVVLVRRGVFFRRADGRSALADVTTGYVQLPGQCQQIAHPVGGDVCTSIGLPVELAQRFAAAPRLAVPPAADLAHRRLLAATRTDGRPQPATRTDRGSWPAERTDRCPRLAEPDGSDLVAELIGALLPAPDGVSAPAIDDVRALLHTDPTLDLTALAAAVGWSPWHLSRVFHRATGDTINRYRRRLRVRAALDHLPTADNLAGLAAYVGFADQAHMTRAVRAETGNTPAALRRALHKQ